MAKQKLQRDVLETCFDGALIIATVLTLGAALLVYGLIKYAVKSANRELYNEIK